MSTNILINSRSMNGIITISDGSATLENGDLTCDDINSSTINSGIFTCRGEFRSNLVGPYTIPTLVSSDYGLLISYGNSSGNGATDFTNYQSTYNITKGGFNFWNKSSTQTLTNLAIIDNSQTYFKSQLTGCTAETPLNTTSVVNKTYVDSNFVDKTTDQTISGIKRFGSIFTTGLSVTQTLGGGGNRFYINVSNNIIQFVPVFNNNLYRFFVKDATANEIASFETDYNSTVINNNLVSNAITHVKEIRWRDQGGSGTEQQSYLSGTGFDFVALFNSNTYRFYCRNSSSVQTTPLTINSTNTTIANKLVSNNLTSPTTTSTNNIYTNLVAGGSVNIGTLSSTNVISGNTTFSSDITIQKNILCDTALYLNNYQPLPSPTTYSSILVQNSDILKFDANFLLNKFQFLVSSNAVLLLDATNTTIYNNLISLSQATFNNICPISNTNATLTNHLTTLGFNNGKYIDFTTDQTISGTKRFGSIFATGLSVTQTLGGGGNRFYINVSSNIIQFVSEFNNNVYRFFVKNATANEIASLETDYNNTVINNNLVSNAITRVKEIRWRDQGGSGTEQQSYLSGTGFDFVALFNSNTYNFYCRNSISNQINALSITHSTTTINNSLYLNAGSRYYSGTNYTEFLQTGTQLTIIPVSLNGSLALFSSAPSTGVQTQQLLINNSGATTTTLTSSNIFSSNYNTSTATGNTNFSFNTTTGTITIGSNITTGSIKLGTETGYVNIYGTMQFFGNNFITDYSTIQQITSTLNIENPIPGGTIKLKTRPSVGTIQDSLVINTTSCDILSPTLNLNSLSTINVLSPNNLTGTINLFTTLSTGVLNIGSSTSSTIFNSISTFNLGTTFKSILTISTMGTFTEIEQTTASNLVLRNTTNDKKIILSTKSASTGQVDSLSITTSSCDILPSTLNLNSSSTINILTPNNLTGVINFLSSLTTGTVNFCSTTFTSVFFLNARLAHKQVQYMNEVKTISGTSIALVFPLEQTWMFSATGATQITVTLPELTASYQAGFNFIIFKTASNTNSVLFTRSGSNTIRGLNSITDVTSVTRLSGTNSVGVGFYTAEVSTGNFVWISY